MTSLLDTDVSLPTVVPFIPGYEIECTLGRGGMGEVFGGRRLADDTLVAIKVGTLDARQNAHLVERLAREAAALAALDHPHIVRIVDSGTTMEGRFYLVTELAAGGDLARRLQTGPLPAEEAARIFRQIVDAVAAAHQAGILHRDLKPANILLEADDRVRVADFSLARLPDTGGGRSFQLTGGGDVLGTPYYLAPEVRLGAAGVDARSDIFALGVLLHEMLTGRVPIGHYVPASQVASVPPAVDRLVARCLAEEPAARPADAGALLIEFEQALRAPLQPSRRGLLVAVSALIVAALALLAQRAMNGTPSQARPHNLRPAKRLPAQATRLQPWENSLGMRFVPVPGMRVLFSVWETRRQDFEVFAAEGPPFVVRADASWRQPLGPMDPNHPVTQVDYPSARDFCAWLTRKERAAGWIGEADVYRLPTDAEWSRAAGLPIEPGESPEAREAAMARQHAYYAWGRTWPPPVTGVPANFAAAEVLAAGGRSALRHRDNWAQTAPVGSFAANEFGLHDLSGNVAEWCSTSWNNHSDEKVLRGGAWNQSSPEVLRLSTRQHALAIARYPGNGFRVVLESVRANTNE